MSYKYGSATYRIHLDNSKRVGRGVQSVMLDGTLLADGNVPLNEDGLTHDVCVVVG